MRYLAPLLIVGILTGCAPLLITGASEQSEDVEYYLKTNDVDSVVREAMKNRELVRGMKPVEVRLVMGDRPDYTARPQSKKKTETGEQWSYENQDPQWTNSVVVTFRDGEVAEYNETAE